MTREVLLMMSLIAASPLLAPAAFYQLAPNLGGVEAHDGVTSRLLAVISHKCIALVLKITDFHYFPIKFKCFSVRIKLITFYANS